MLSQIMLKALDGREHRKNIIIRLCGRHSRFREILSPEGMSIFPSTLIVGIKNHNMALEYGYGLRSSSDFKLQPMQSMEKIHEPNEP